MGLRSAGLVALLALGLAWTGANGALAARRLPKEKSRRSWVDLLEFRSIDGIGNNPTHPMWGSVGSALLRTRDLPDYGDGVSSLAGQGRPGARVVSNVVAVSPGPRPNPQGVTDMFWQWGQFVDHDIDLTPGTDPPEPADIEVPNGDSHFDPFHTGTQVIGFNRSAYVPFSGTGVREQVNQITAYIDASNVYGSGPTRAGVLRWPGGYLKTSAGRLLPFNTAMLPNAPSDSPTLFLAGDVRANEQVGLTSLHTLFVREHNRLVRLLRRMKLPADTRYQVARAIVGAEIQAITYREFLPIMLGRHALSRYRGYDSSVDPSIANIFSTAAYRFGHTMVAPQLLRLDRKGKPIAAGHLALRDAFFDPRQLIDHGGIEPILRGLATQQAEAVDNFIVEDLRSFLFGPPGSGGMDLAAMNIQRGRDHGLPGYNDAREQWGLPRVTTFAEITSDPLMAGRFAAVYDSVDDVDLWVGGLGEDPVDGGLVGPLFAGIIADQFERLRDGDRFYYERLPRVLVRYIERLDLRTIIQLNSSIGTELPRDVFHVQAASHGKSRKGRHSP